MKYFGQDTKGNDVYLHTLENEKIRFSVMDYGATLVSFTDKKTGRDIVLGFDDMQGYLGQDCYIGACIGRTANRIGKGLFTLNGKTYGPLFINNGGNCNHGGKEGFDKKIFKAEEKEDRLIFTYLSPDMEEGYPGNLAVKITYILLDSGIEIISEGETDRDTLFAFTNHSYFNLDMSQTVFDHRIRLDSHLYAENDENGMAEEKMNEVTGTPYDFTEYKTLRQGYAEVGEKGFDHYYEVEGEGIRHMAAAECNDLELHMSSDFPGFHLYTAYWLGEWTGKYGFRTGSSAAFCFEAEYHPNGINYETVTAKPIVYAGRPMKHHIVFEIRHPER